MNALKFVVGCLAPAVFLLGVGDLVRKRYIIGSVLTAVGLTIFFLIRWAVHEVVGSGGIFGGGSPSPLAAPMVIMAPVLYLVLWLVNDIRYSNDWIREVESGERSVTLGKRMVVYVGSMFPALLLATIILIGSQR